MTSPGTGVVRVLRALCFLAAALALTVGAHVMAGGSASTFAMAATALLLWPLALAASRRRRTMVSLLPGLAVGQVAGHLLLTTLTAPAGGGGQSIDCLQHAAHLRSAAGSCTSQAMTADPLSWATHASDGAMSHSMSGSMSGSTSLGMVTAHVATTVIAAILMARAETILWRILDLLIRRLVLPSLGVRRLPPAPRDLLLARTPHLLRATPRRGPPLLAA